jgi:hypothetical protein
MRRTVFSKIFMLATGVIAVMAIMFSVSHNNSDSESGKAKPATEQSSDHTLINAPADALPGSATVQIISKTFLLLETLLPACELESDSFLPVTIFIRHFSVLLRSTISPNAP